MTSVQLSWPDKVLYPDAGYTKADMADRDHARPAGRAQRRLD